MTPKQWKSLYRRPAWKSKRDAVVKAAGGVCETCGSTKDIQVHHPHYEPGKMPWEYDDLQCLCASCHRKADWKRKRVNQFQQVPSQNVLVGKFFHSFDQSDTELGKTVKWQGVVLGEAQSGIFLVQLFSWLDGAPTNSTLVHFSDMFDWFFYRDSEEMTHSYDYGVARRYRYDQQPRKEPPCPSVS